MKQIVFLILSLVIVSCVPPTKFRTLQSQATTSEEENKALKAEVDRLNIEVRETGSKLSRMEEKMAKVAEDTMNMIEEITSLQDENITLSRDYQDLYEANQALVKGSGEEIRKLMADLQEAQQNMQDKEKTLNTREAELSKMQSELASRNQRLADLEKILAEQEAAVSGLKRKVTDALLGFENQGLTITQKNGKVYVSLEEQLLFGSGSTVVDQKGVSALKNLASVLEANPEINILIEGHTDDVPVKSGSVYKDNWDLSVLRSTAVARILLQGSGIDPVRITTAGRSQYLPVENAKTAEARTKNRRTEIILSPKLDELYDLIGQ
jgi:chemotaxis protein MotB